MAALNPAEKEGGWARTNAPTNVFFLSCAATAIVYPTSEKACPLMPNNCVWYIIQ